MNRVAVSILAAGIALLALMPGMAITGGTTQRVSVTSAEIEANGDSTEVAVSDNGRFVAFTSAAADLVSGDTNGYLDIFVRDRLNGTTERVSVDSAGAQATGGDSTSASISGDGRYVAFKSIATNLVPGDTNNAPDIFVRDRTAGTTERVSLGTAGEQASATSDEPDISADGRYVVFQSNGIAFPNPTGIGRLDIFLRDRTAGTTELVSISDSEEQAAGGGSQNPTVSDDGNLIAFESTANNLSPADTSLHSDIFVRNRSAGTTTLVSVNSSEVQSNYINDSPAISGNGQFVAFISGSDNLVSVDTNNAYDVFVRDLIAGTTELASVTTAEAQITGGNANRPAIGGDGRFVAFDSYANNLDPADTYYSSDIFVRDRLLGTTERVSATPVAEAGDDSFTPSISNDGGVVGFESLAKDLVSDDTNNKSDAFVHAYDLDLDGVADWVDNCPTVANTDGQLADVDGDLAGDACDAVGTGNADCNQEVNAVDALKILRYVAALSVSQSEPCSDVGTPIGSGFDQGDADCSGGDPKATDALKVLRAVAGLSVTTSCAGPVKGT